jgi:hypothetical protein
METDVSEVLTASIIRAMNKPSCSCLTSGKKFLIKYEMQYCPSELLKIVLYKVFCIIKATTFYTNHKKPIKFVEKFVVWVIYETLLDKLVVT